MNWLQKMFAGDKKKKEEEQFSKLVNEKSGDPAFSYRLEWITAYGKKDFKSALDKVNQALKVIPNSPDYLGLRAMTHFMLDNYAAAVADMKAALKGNPTQKEALGVKEALKTDAAISRDKAREWIKKNDVRQAMDALNKAAELEPDNPATFVFRGLQYAESKNYDAAIKDVTHALELDPKYPDGQKILQAIKGASKEKLVETKRSFFFICSGNASLIQHYHNLFKQAASADSAKSMILESPAYFSADSSTLSLRAQEAGKNSVKFEGQSIMGSKASPVMKMEEVLQHLKIASFGKLHVAYISVNQAGVSWVQKVYEELLKQALTQGILPYEMYVTNNKEAARFMIGSFEKVS